MIPGIVAGRRSKSSVVLYDFEYDFLDVAGSFTFSRNGTVTRYLVGSNPPVPGMWWVGVPDPGIGDDYEIRFTVVRGLVSGGDARGVWHRLDLNRYFTFHDYQNFQVLVEIRSRQSQKVLAASYFWRGFAP